MSDTRSSDRIAKNLAEFEKEFRRTVGQQLRVRVRKRLEEEAGEASTLSDHTLEDLAAMGHPYRRGAIPNVPHDDALIHRQTEGGVGFADSFVSEIREHGDETELALLNTAPHWQYLKHGTSKMRRRPLGEYLDAVIRDELFPEFVDSIRRTLKRLKLTR